jgi:FkbM family methyltransferase
VPDGGLDRCANVGAYTLVAALRPGSPARVMAFEPSYTTFVSLCQNIALNQVLDRVVPLQVALSDSTGLGHFGYSGTVAGAAMHVLERPGTTAAPDFKPVLRQPIMTFRLDDLIAQLSLPRPNHLKIDVDGAEVAVLEGAAATLTDPALRSIMIEVLLMQTDDVMRLLECAS